MRTRKSGTGGFTDVAIRLGLAIGDHRVVAVRVSSRGEVELALEAELTEAPSAGAPWTELEEALRGLLQDAGARSAVADVALLPPLSCSKCVGVPPVSASQLDPLVTRNLRRYFAVPFSAPLARAHPVASRGGKVTRALAVCAGVGAVTAVHQAAEAAGVRVASMTAGPVALAEGVRRILGRGRTRTEVKWDARGWSGAMEIEAGVPRWMEDWSSLSAPARADGSTSMRASADGGEPPAYTVVLSDVGVGGVDLAGRREGAMPGSGSGAEGHDPWILSAVGAVCRGHQAPSLLPGSRLAEFRRATRRRVAVLWAAAAGLALLSAGIHGYGLKRELSTIEAARGLISPQVSRALEIRRTAYAVQDRLQALDAIERDTPRWTPALAALTEVLPRSTYLVSLSTDGLSVRLGGVTRATENIAPELEESPYFQDVRLMNVRAASRPGDGGTEFDLSLALQPSTSATAQGEGGQ